MRAVEMMRAANSAAPRVELSPSLLQKKNAETQRRQQNPEFAVFLFAASRSLCAFAFFFS
jgi:hypothetical protein